MRHTRSTAQLVGEATAYVFALISSVLLKSLFIAPVFFLLVYVFEQRLPSPDKWFGFMFAAIAFSRPPDREKVKTYWQRVRERMEEKHSDALSGERK